MNQVNTILQLLEKYGVFLNPEHDLEENLFDFGLDSIGSILLLCEIEEMFQIRIEFEVFSNIETLTVNALLEVISNSEANMDNPIQCV